MIDLQTLETAIASVDVTTPDGNTRTVHVEANTNTNGDGWVELRVTGRAKAVFVMTQETVSDFENVRGAGTARALFMDMLDAVADNLRTTGRPIVADRP